MAETKIRFTAPEFDGAEDQLGTLIDKLPLIMDHIARGRRGKHALQGPSDIDITPTAIDEEQLFLLSSRHETAAPPGMVGVLQPIDAVFYIGTDHSDAFLSERRDDGPEGSNYQLTTVETLILHRLGSLARSHDQINSPLNTPDS
jgi:hypothetical protein